MASKRFRFADEFADVMGGLSDDDSSLSGAGSKSRRLSFKGMGAKVATHMLGVDGTKALAPSGAAIVGQEFVRDPVALGQVAQSLLDVLPTKQHASTEYACLRQTVRTNSAAVVAKGATKPTSVYTVTPAAQHPVAAARAPDLPRRQPGLDANRIGLYRHHQCTFRTNARHPRSAIFPDTSGGVVQHQFVRPMMPTITINPEPDADHPIGDLNDGKPRRGRHPERRSTRHVQRGDLPRDVYADVAGSGVHVAEPDGKAQARAVVAPHTPDAVCATDATQAGDTTLAERTRHTSDAPSDRE